MITSDDNVSLSLQLSLVLLFFYMDLLHRYISYLECFLIKEDADRNVAFEIRRIDITKRICPDHSKIYARSLFNFFNAVLYRVRGLGHLFLPPRCFLSSDPLVRSEVRSPRRINIWLPIIGFATLCSIKKKKKKREEKEIRKNETDHYKTNREVKYNLRVNFRTE